MRRILAGFALALLMVAPVVAAAPQPMTWSLLFSTYDQPVEQQTPGGALQPDQSLWVVNPGPCLWDPDDGLDGRFYGALGKGQSASHTECIILDHQNHLVGLSASNELAGSITVSSPIGPTIGGWTAADDCILTPEYDHEVVATLPEIEGSNGGHGDRVTVTWTVTNIAGHRLNRTGAFTTIRLATGDAITAWGC